jgi:hypothetical protein
MSAFFEISGLNVYLQIIVTIISISVHLFATRNKKRAVSALELIALYTIGLAGWFTITSGVFGHIIYADEVATSIGWPLHSGFQMELAFAAIGIGIVGFGGFWSRSFWLPFIIAKTSFMLGAGITHIIHMVQGNNFSPSNTGIVLYWDFLLPVILIALYIFYRHEQNALQQKESNT